MTETSNLVSRRPVLGAGIAVAATALVSACGGSSADSDDGPDSAADAGPGTGSTGGTTGGAIVQVSDVPVGGAVSAKAPDGKPIIVAQPEQGQVVAFSARCTHMGCTVAPAGKELDCPCHGSVYNLQGKNVGGPAPRPLTPFAVRVEGGAVLPA